MKEHLKRLTILDEIRGFSVISMVLFHLCYDLDAIFDIHLAWFESPLQDIWRASISWTFIFIAGYMCSFSRNNWRRGAMLLGVATLIWIVTSIIAVDVPISFGIIFCLAVCTLIAAWLNEHLKLSVHVGVLAVLFTFFILLLPLSKGVIGVGNLVIPVSTQLYEWQIFSFLGFPGPGFVSGDYYPVLPYLLLFLTGNYTSIFMSRFEYPSFAYKRHSKVLEWVGTHALGIYLIHQPVIYLVLALWFGAL